MTALSKARYGHPNDDRSYFRVNILLRGELSEGSAVTKCAYVLKGILDGRMYDT